MMNLYKIHKNPKKLDWYKKYNRLLEAIVEYQVFDDMGSILHIIKREPGYIHWYAKEVIKGRWIEMEPYIMREPYYIYNYARNVMHGRWVEAEQYIMKSPPWACQYAVYIIEDRWEEAEQYIIKDNDWWKQYCWKLNVKFI